ncbi:MAG: protein kinase [Planctomycetaceae bacterium]
MSQPQSPGQSSSVERATASFQFQREPMPLDGGATVINPERRGAGSSIEVPPQAASGLWNRLFPTQPTPDGLPNNPAGCRLGHFIIEEAIGSGGMGAVFRAIDERLQRVVALKVLAPALSRDVGSVQRFLNEARSAARLDHDNIARVFFIGDDQGLHFIAHEFVTGRNVRDLIRERGPLEPSEAVNYTLQLASALNHTAAAGVVHRDIKPSNIIITHNGRAKLVDLGLAKKQNSESVGELTIAGTTLGTFDYISPEQAKDPRNVDVRSDIYSLGCTVYHMLTGEPPYPEGTVLQKLLDHQGKDAPDPSAKNPRVPERLSQIVRKMMASDPRARYATPDELILDLLPIAAGYGLRGTNPEGLVWTTTKPPQERFWERHVGWVVTAAMLLLIVFLINNFNQPGPRPTPPASNGSPVARTDNRTPSAEAKKSSPMAAAPATSDDSTSPSLGNSSTTDDSTDPPTLFEGITSVARAPLTGSEDATSPTPTKADGARAPAANGTAVDSRRPVEAQRPQLPATSSVASTNREDVEVPRTDDVPQAAPQISVLTELGDPKTYPTLEAAAADARDGAIVELRYNGWRGSYEKPLRIGNKKLTIRSARGYRPSVRFTPRQIPAEGFETRMISVNGGSVDLVNLDIEMAVRDEVNTDNWALISLAGSGRVRMEGVNLTVPNSGIRSAAIVEIVSGTDRSLDKMKMPKTGTGGAPPLFDIRIGESFIAGAGDLIVERDTAPCQIDIERSAIALSGSVISVFGSDDSRAEEAEIALDIEHATCVLGRGFLHMDSGALPRYLLPVTVNARNNIFAAGAAGQFVSMTGNTSPEDFRRLLRWEGAKNFYDRFETFWSITSQQISGSESAFRFEDWKRVLGEADSDANNGGIVWRRPWSEWSETFRRNAAGLRPEDLALARGSLAVAGATDGSDVGADLTRLPGAAPAPVESLDQ